MKMHDLTEELEKTWHSIADGWNHLADHASNALTHFSGSASKDADGQTAAKSPSWGLLNADVYDEGDKLSIELEVPGLEADDFNINVVNNVLVISGEKRFERSETKGEYRVMERSYGHFSRSIPLGYEVDTKSADARYKNGVLHVELEKMPYQQKRHITVN